MKRQMWPMAVIAIAVTLAAWTTVAQARQQETARATITLATAGGTCGATVAGNVGNTETIRTRRGATIQWTVINNCAGSSAVSLTGWVRKSDRAAAFPGDPNGRLNCSVDAGQRCTLTAVIRRDAEATTYSYTVSLNGLLLDPDVIIDP